MPNRGDSNEPHRRADPSSYRHSIDRTGPRSGAHHTLTTATADISGAEPAIPSAGVRAGEIIGHRLWWVVPFLDRNRELWLRSLAHEQFWAPGEVISGDTHTIVKHTPAGPIWGGVYSYKTSNHLAKESAFWVLYSVFPLVCGTIKMWGDVVEHKEGYRAEYAKVASLRAVLCGAVDLAALRRRYRV